MRKRCRTRRRNASKLKKRTMRHFWGRGRTRSRRTRPRKTRRRRSRPRKTRRGKRTVRGGVGRQFGGAIDCGCSPKEGSTFHCFCDDEDGNNKNMYRNKSRKLDVVDDMYGSSEQIEYKYSKYNYNDDTDTIIVSDDNQILKYLISGHLCLSIFFKHKESIQMYLSTGTSSINSNENFPGVFFSRPESGIVEYTHQIAHSGDIYQCTPKNLWFSLFIKEIFNIIFYYDKEKIYILNDLKDEIDVPFSNNNFDTIIPNIFHIFKSVKECHTREDKAYRITVIVGNLVLYFMSNNHEYTNNKTLLLSLISSYITKFQYFYYFFKKFCYWRDVQVSAMLGWDSLKDKQLTYYIYRDDNMLTYVDTTQQQHRTVNNFDMIKNFVLSKNFVMVGSDSYEFKDRKNRLTEISSEAQELVRRSDNIDRRYSLENNNKKAMQHIQHQKKEDDVEDDKRKDDKKKDYLENF